MSINYKSEDSVEIIDFSMKDFATTCLSKWKWFLLSMIVFVGAGVFYIICQQPEYERSEEILIKDQDTGGGVGDIANAFSSFGLVSSNTSVYNELISLKSPAVMYEVVKRLNLDMNYETPGIFHSNTLYGKTLPIEVDLKDLHAEQGASFDMELYPDGRARLWNFTISTEEGKEKFNEEVSVSKDKDVVKTPVGYLKFKFVPDYVWQEDDDAFRIKVFKLPMQTTIENYDKKLNADLTDPDAEVIELSIKDVNIQRAVDILNMILTVYNENWIEDKNRMAVATSAFIDERLRLIEEELGNVDNSIAKYQTTTGTPDLIASAQMSMEKEAMLDQNMIDIDNQLTVAKYMKNFLDDQSNRFCIIPTNMVIGNTTIEKEISSYNSLLLIRNNLISNSSERNPIVVDYDSQLKGMRESIISSMNAQISGLQKMMENAVAEKKKTINKIAGTSEKALPLLSEERQQKVKEGLYLFLLQKREENELSRKFTADNTRVITPPMGSFKPVSPRKKLILAIACFGGLALPLILIYLSEAGNNKIRSKKDLDCIKMPFAGEIPNVGKKKKLIPCHKGKINRLKDEKPPLQVVEEGKRDVVNEAFRVIRSNIEFMSGKHNGSQSIMLTSFNPGSGKSFIAYNLGLSFALKRKKILLVDCDLRHGSSSMFVGMPQKGLTNYLTESVEDWRSMVVKSPSSDFMSILPIGKIPPNPAELLENNRLRKLLEEAKMEYDCILLDCPPVNIVVDTQIVEQYADRTLFVVRAGLLERSALKELNDFYEDKKFKNLSVILNGTDAVHSRYYTYGNYQSYGG